MSAYEAAREAAGATYKRHLCIDCGVRLYNQHRAKKHEAKTGHRTKVNERAERARAKYVARQNPSYLDRLVAKDREGYERGEA